jgi:hypothetical protein
MTRELTPQSQQIHRLLRNLSVMKTHQQVRLIKWIRHFEHTHEYLQANFDRLEKTVNNFITRRKHDLPTKHK